MPQLLQRLRLPLVFHLRKHKRRIFCLWRRTVSSGQLYLYNVPDSVKLAHSSASSSGSFVFRSLSIPSSPPRKMTKLHEHLHLPNPSQWPQSPKHNSLSALPLNNMPLDTPASLPQKHEVDALSLENPRHACGQDKFGWSWGTWLGVWRWCWRWRANRGGMCTLLSLHLKMCRLRRVNVRAMTQDPDEPYISSRAFLRQWMYRSAISITR